MSNIEKNLQEIKDFPIENYYKKGLYEKHFKLYNMHRTLSHHIKHYETKLFPNLSVIKYRWGLASSQFEKRLIPQKDYNNQISGLKKEIVNIESEIKKSHPVLKEIWEI